MDAKAIRRLFSKLSRCLSLLRMLRFDCLHVKILIWIRGSVQEGAWAASDSTGMPFMMQQSSRCSSANPTYRPTDCHYVTGFMEVQRNFQLHFKSKAWSKKLKTCRRSEFKSQNARQPYRLLEREYGGESGSSPAASIRGYVRKARRDHLPPYLTI